MARPSFVFFSFCMRVNYKNSKALKRAKGRLLQLFTIRLFFYHTFNTFAVKDALIQCSFYNFMTTLCKLFYNHLLK